jgi:uncharacterized protein YdaU (DUF1376 family)
MASLFGNEAHMNKVRRIDFYPDEWLAGNKRLSVTARGVYITICALIYSEGRSLDYSDADLAHECRMSPDDIAPILASLEELGKIRRVRGRITNDRCEAELAKALDRIAKAKEAGRVGGKRTQSRKPLEDKAYQASDRLSDAQANAQALLKLTNNQQPTTNNTNPNGLGAEAPRNSLEKDYFETGKRILGSKAGGVLANLLKVKGTPADAYAVLIAAESAQSPMEYVQGAIRSGKPIPPPQPVKIPDPQYDEARADVQRQMAERKKRRETKIADAG